jgi:hypothetical protein
MGLVKKASKLLEGIRRHKNEIRSPLRPRDGDLNVRPRGRLGELVAARKLRRQRTTVEATRIESNEHNSEESMAQELAYTDDQGLQHIQRPRIPRTMSDTQRIQIIEDEEEEDPAEAAYEGESESEDEVDESVAEDMRKLEESFRGISRKYRLINRIGEGNMSGILTKLPN